MDGEWPSYGDSLPYGLLPQSDTLAITGNSISNSMLSLATLPLYRQSAFHFTFGKLLIGGFKSNLTITFTLLSLPLFWSCWWDLEEHIQGICFSTPSGILDMRWGSSLFTRDWLILSLCCRLEPYLQVFIGITCMRTLATTLFNRFTFRISLCLFHY